MKSLFSKKRKTLLMSFRNNVEFIAKNTRCKIKNPEQYRSISFKNNNAQKVNYAQIIF